MCGRVLRHVWSYLYVGAKSAAPPPILRASSLNPTRWPLISTDSLQDAAPSDDGAVACSADPPAVLGDNAACAAPDAGSSDLVSVPLVSLTLRATERGAWGPRWGWGARMREVCYVHAAFVGPMLRAASMCVHADATTMPRPPSAA